jgi:hypothetical protein
LIYQHERPAHLAARIGVEQRTGFGMPRRARWNEERILRELERFCDGTRGVADRTGVHRGRPPAARQRGESKSCCWPRRSLTPSISGSVSRPTWPAKRQRVRLASEPRIAGVRTGTTTETRRLRTRAERTPAAERLAAPTTRANTARNARAERDPYARWAPAREAAFLARYAPRITRSVVARLHVSAPGWLVLHIFGPIAWWPGHHQPVTLDRVLTRRKARLRSRARAGSAGHRPSPSRPARRAELHRDSGPRDGSLALAVRYRCRPPRLPDPRGIDSRAFAAASVGWRFCPMTAATCCLVLWCGRPSVPRISSPITRQNCGGPGSLI